MHQNAFGGRAPPGITGKLTALPQIPSWILGVGAGKKGEGKGREEGKEREKRKGGERERKEEGRDHPPQKKSWL